MTAALNTNHVISPEQAIELFIAGATSIDVRAEVEFSLGSLPNSTNMPILVSAERELIGKTYAESGNNAAIALGHELVSGEKKESRVTNWISQIQCSNTGIIFCSRGGLRSQIAQRWLADRNIPIERITGGYKAARRVLTEKFNAKLEHASLLVISGKTGSGKTVLLKKLRQTVPILDLEGLACHSGSSFGCIKGIQPSQATFENELFLQLLQKESPGTSIILEDESRKIGRRILPPLLYQRMSEAPRVLLEAPLPERANNILEEYVVSPLNKLADENDTDPLTTIENYLLSSVERIAEKLGDERRRVCIRLIKEAASEQRSSGDTAGHLAWIEILLQDYYDPCYEYDLMRKSSLVIFQGNSIELENHLISNAHAPSASVC